MGRYGSPSLRSAREAGHVGDDGRRGWTYLGVRRGGGVGGGGGVALGGVLCRGEGLFVGVSGRAEPGDLRGRRLGRGVRLRVDQLIDGVSQLSINQPMHEAL